MEKLLPNVPMPVIILETETEVEDGPSRALQWGTVDSQDVEVGGVGDSGLNDTGEDEADLRLGTEADMDSQTAGIDDISIQLIVHESTGPMAEAEGMYTLPLNKH